MIFLNRLAAASRAVAVYLLVAYVLLLGGQYYGLVAFQINVLSTILMSIGAIIWIGWRIKRRSGFAQTPLDLPLFIGLGAAAVSAIFSLDPSRSAGALFLGAVWACVYWITADGLSEGLSRRTLARAVYLSGAVIAAIAFIQVTFFWRDWLSLGLLPQVSFRVAAPNPTAAFLNFIWTLWLAELIESKRWWQRIVLIVLLIVSGIVMLYTSSRGGWLGMASGAFVFALLYRHSLFNVARAIYSRPMLRIVIALSAVAAVVAVSAIAIRQWSHATHAPTIVSSREEFWPPAWEAFLRSPLSGTGLFTYSSTYLASLSVPPRGIFNQAHGLVFNLLSETGLIGLGAAIFALIVFVKNVGQVGNLPKNVGQVTNLPKNVGQVFNLPIHVGQVANLSNTEASWRVAALASLCGTFAHSFVETTYVNPPVMALIAIACAMMMPTTSRGWRNGIVLVGICAYTLWSVWAYQPLHEGVELGDQGKWKEAAALLDEAIRRDPFSTWTKLQLGYALHRSGNYSRAIDLYREALKREPSYSMNWANLAAAQWANGDRDEAKLTLARARTLAPDATLFRVIESKWTGTPPPLIKPDEVDERLALVVAGKLSPDELTKDRERLAASLELREIGFSQVIQLAEIEITQKNLPRADYLLNYATAMRGDSPITLEFAYGDLDAARGDLRSAAIHYSRVWELYSLPDDTGYGWLIFVREGFRENIAPELAALPLPHHIILRLQTLSAWYRVLGEDELANRFERITK
ncbi:MAG: O-antigen ligase family protein [Chloroflexi bacterium]|nr:O-antigen ligase family protein [Chloroflexota bacterium]